MEVRVNDPGQNSSLTLLIQLDVKDVMTTARTRVYMSQRPLTSIHSFDVADRCEFDS